MVIVNSFSPMARDPFAKSNIYPLGAHESVDRATPWARRRSALPSGRMMPKWLRPFSSLMKAIKSPFGDQDVMI